MRALAARILLPVAAVAGWMAATSLCAQTQDPRERAIQELADLALVASPELAADALLKLIERGHIKDPELKRNVLETAWSLAPRATYAFEVQPAVGMQTDSDSGSLSAALANGLSTAGIQTRVISQMAKIDTSAAREMFRQMSMPAAEAIDCSVDRYISHRAYFSALAVVEQTFSRQEVMDRERLKFLVEAMVLTNPEGFESALDWLMNDQSLDNLEFATLILSWAEKLERARFSDRVFASRSPRELLTSITTRAKLVELRGAQLPALLRAFRSYFITHARAPRCAESRKQGGSEEDTRTAFNRFAQIFPEIPAITAEQIKPDSFGDAAKVAVYLSKENSKVWQIKLDYSHLRFGSEEQQAVNDKQKRSDGMKPYLTLEQRSTPEWNEEALRFLNQLENWSRELGQSNRELFFQKAEWFGALAQIVPEGKLREALVSSYVNFLTTSPIKTESPPEWFMWVNRLIMSEEVPDRQAWLDQIEAVSDPAMSVYCRLARLSL